MALLFLVSTLWSNRMESLIAKAKEAAPMTAIVAGVLSVTSFPLPFDFSHTTAAWVSLGALALHVGGIFAKKTA